MNLKELQEELQKAIDVRESSINGIVDIYDKKGQLVNNLVMLIGWEDDEGVTHFNNSEIQDTPIIVVDKGSLVYLFENQETVPAEQPASNIMLKVSFSEKENGLGIETQIMKNPKGLKNLFVGMGCFYGINQGVLDATLKKNNSVLKVKPKTTTSTPVGQLGSFSSFNGYSGFQLHSAYPEMPDLSINIDLPYPNNTRVDIESRSFPYKSSHTNLLHRLTQETGELKWIEAGIIYASPGDTSPSFTLELFEGK